MMLAYAEPPEQELPSQKANQIFLSKRTTWEFNQRSGDRYVGYRALWMKVIIRAAFDWVSYRDSTKLETRKIAESSYRWLFETNALFNSFENVCHLVDLPPETIRGWVKGLTKEHVAKIEHLEREPCGPSQVAIMVAQHKLLRDKAPDETD